MTTSDSDRCPNCFATIAGTPCPGCGWRTGLDNPPPALALGTLLDGRYRIGRVLGHGGFGITYLAWDDNLHLRLAIKEYFPRDSAGRGVDGVSLAVYSGPAAEQFAYGLDRFIEEARALARFDQHPGIVTVKNFFRAHGTGYCVMDYVEGITLRQYLDQQPGGKIPVEAALKLLTPVADALRAVHKEGLLHRDIAPDNIYLSQDGRIKLLDFGAARYAAGEHSKSLSMVLKPGYSPEEQYRTKGRQGPWTDVYGLGATVYRAITGTLPPESLDRLDQDELVPPSRLGVAITPAQEAVLLKALAVKADQRWQDMAAFQQGWRTENTIASKPVADRNESAPVPPIEAPPSNTGKKNKLRTLLAVVAGLVFVLVMAAVYFSENVKTDRDFSKPGLAQVEAAASLEEGDAAYDRGDYKRALAIYGPLAESGNSSAQVGIGKLYEEGRGLPKDVSEALRLYRKAAEQENAYAQCALGSMYKKGLGVSQDDSEAERWYRLAVPTLRKAAEQGDAKSQYYLGMSYAEGDGVPKDEAEAVRWLRKAAEMGKVSAQVELSSMYRKGLGVGKDDAESARWVRKAAEKDNPVAQWTLGTMYERGFGVDKDDAEAARWYRKAASWFHKAADQGDGDAFVHIGMMYQKGRGVFKDEAEAVQWYRKAAEQGNVPGQFYLGMMYQEGRGVVKDEAEAVRWYRKAAEQGDASGQVQLGVMYQMGLGVDKDYTEAARWYRKAAEQGEANGQFLLGSMYENGLGVIKDDAEAVRWYRKAAELGDARAKSALERLGR